MAIKYLIKKNIIDDELSEIDFDFMREWDCDYGNEDSDDPNDFHYYDFIISQHGSADGFPIKIDRVIEYLQNMKDSGCNYVEMGYHCDHIGYEFSGFMIEEATPDQIEVFVNEKMAKESKNKEIRELEMKIKELRYGPDSRKTFY